MKISKSVDQWQRHSHSKPLLAYKYITTETVQFRSSISLGFIERIRRKKERKERICNHFFRVVCENLWTQKPKNDRMLVLMVLPTRVIHMQQKTPTEGKKPQFIVISILRQIRLTKSAIPMIFLGCILIFRLFCLSLSLAPWSLLASCILNNSILHEIGWPFSQQKKKPNRKIRFSIKAFNYWKHLLDGYSNEMCFSSLRFSWNQSFRWAYFFLSRWFLATKNPLSSTESHFV